MSIGPSCMRAVQWSFQIMKRFHSLKKITLFFMKAILQIGRCSYTIKQEFRIVNPITKRVLDPNKPTWEHLKTRTPHSYRQVILKILRDFYILKKVVDDYKFIIRASLCNHLSQFQSVLLKTNMPLGQQILFLIKKNKDRLDQQPSQKD